MSSLGSTKRTNVSDTREELERTQILAAGRRPTIHPCIVHHGHHHDRKRTKDYVYNQEMVRGKDSGEEREMERMSFRFTFLKVSQLKINN